MSRHGIITDTDKKYYSGSRDMKYIIANFKSNKNRPEHEAWMKVFRLSFPQFAKGKENLSVVLCPSAPFLSLTSDILREDDDNENVHLGSQDISPFPAGAYTGAVGTKNLEDLFVSYAIVGHSERRTYFHETNNDVANKVREARLASITPIVCVSRETISSQANALEDADRAHVMVAFEPIDHIGTGIADTLDDILKVRVLVKEAFGDVPFIYGGSVDPHTDKELLTHPDIDGFLIGSACLDAREFIQLIHLVS